MRRGLGLFLLGLPLFSGCAEFRERQRLKTEMMREALGMMKGMHGEMPGGIPPGFTVRSVTPVAEPAASPESGR
ncbi:MAG TPA: hypothetical protein VG406_12645 [Isosphaeraceae bacterium]|jgi:hypothetical protein|nr:hypothetical protein [Isosphaeraceae bacterium]